MTDEQYDAAEEDLLVRMQLMMERDSGHVEPIVLSPVLDDDSLDDPIVKSFSSERERAKDEYRVYCNIVKRRNHVPQSFSGTVLRLGCIRMGKVATRGDDIKASHPFVTCNLATYIGDDGRFDLVSFLELQRATFPTLYKLAVCLASVRTNEVGCERFFSTAGYVSCPRRTSLKVRNYECLATLKANIRNVFIDERWVVNQYLMMEHKKNWSDLDKDGDDLRVLKLERELLAESLGVSPDTLTETTMEEPVAVVQAVEVIEIDEVLGA
jgi:hAT family C-terminal dimerisation region